MDRRLFLKGSSLAFTLGAFGVDAHASVCVTTPHLEGELPEDVLAAISTTGQFRHHHFLHVPPAILLNPPAEGWSTISSMMVPNLGIGEFFFRDREVRKQFHCHQIYFSHRQLLGISGGEEMEVIAYIRAGDGSATPNHSFFFNSTDFDKHFADLESEALIGGFVRTRSACDIREHGGVTIFSGKGIVTVTEVATLERLKGY